MTTHRATRMYAGLLRLYPARFQTEHAAEMEAVFAQLITEAAGRGQLPVWRVCGRELRDLPLAVWREHWHEHLTREDFGMKTLRPGQILVAGTWQLTLAWLTPLWLFLLAVMVEGFPRPPLSLAAAGAAFAIGVALSLGLLIMRRLPLEVLFYSLTPFLFLYDFDEISTTYKSPYLLACGLLLSLGLGAYQAGRFNRLVRGLILLGSAALVWLLAQHAALNFWQMADALGYLRCMPDAQGCPPLTGQETPWWRLFFGP